MKYPDAKISLNIERCELISMRCTRSQLPTRKATDVALLVCNVRIILNRHLSNTQMPESRSNFPLCPHKTQQRPVTQKMTHTSTSWCHARLEDVSEAFICYLETYPAVTSIGFILVYLLFLLGGGFWLGQRWTLPSTRDTGAGQLQPRVKDNGTRDK
jgi:hypothetical protein